MALNIIPYGTNFNFIGKRYIAFALSIITLVGTLVLIPARGLNLGIDFTGGILIDAQFPAKIELAAMREQMKETGLKDVSLQTFGEDTQVLIRIGQSSESDQERQATIALVKKTLATHYGENIEYRKVDYVGPKVGGELIRSGIISTVLAVLGIMLYIWLRFEWQYGVAAIASLVHDAVVTVGFLCITQLEFNMSSIAAVLTIIGYSINDTVVAFDRIRDNIKKYKKMPMPDLLNRSINDNLARMILTPATTMMALIALILVGGEVVRSFSYAMAFGVVVGTFSSLYVAAPLLLYMKPLRQNEAAQTVSA